MQVLRSVCGVVVVGFVAAAIGGCQPPAGAPASKPTTEDSNPAGGTDDHAHSATTEEGSGGH